MIRQRSFELARKIVRVNDKREFVKGFTGDCEPAYPDAKLPEYSTKFSAGADFFCAEEVVIPSIWKLLFNKLVFSLLISDKASDSDKEVVNKLFSPTLVHTGIKANMYEDEVLELYNRSSNPKKLGLILANSVGVVDADYYNCEDNDGEILFSYYNIKPWDVTLKVGDKVGQGVFKKVLRPEVGLVVKEETRKGGHGSTGR